MRRRFRSMVMEQLGPRRLLTQIPELLGDFELCQAASAPIQYKGADAYAVAAGLGFCAGRHNYDSLVRTNGTTAAVIGIELGESVLLDSFRQLNGINFFGVLTSGYSFIHLYATDGTRRGTKLIAENLGAAPLEFNGELFILADAGRELWKTDGTNTQKLADFSPTYAESLYIAGDEIVIQGREAYWKTDGTAENTRKVFDQPDQLPRNITGRRDIRHWRSSSTSFITGHFYYQTVDGESRTSLAFAEVDVVNETIRRELIEFPGNHSTYIPNEDGSAAVFSIGGSSTRRATDWFTDWTVAGTQPFSNEESSGTPVATGSFGNSQTFIHMRYADSEVIWGFDADGARELIRTSGKIKSIEIVPTLGNSLLILTRDHGEGAISLSDGFSTTLLAKNPEFGHIRSVTEWRGNIFFKAGGRLWRTDGTEPGTVPLHPISGEMYETTDAIFFVSGTALWKTTDAMQGAIMAHDRSEVLASTDKYLIVGDTETEQVILRGDADQPDRSIQAIGQVISEPELKLSDGQSIIFERENKLGRTEFWVTDGSRHGTHQIGILPPQRSGNDGCLLRSGLVEVGDYVLFSMNYCNNNDFDHSTYSMKLDRTPDSPPLNKSSIDFQSEGTTGDVDFADLDADGDLDVYVSILQGEDEIWLNDGTSRFERSRQSLSLRSNVAAELADLDQDGDVDAVLASPEGNEIWMNDGKGILRGPTPIGRSDLLAMDVALADFNADGTPDIYFANDAAQGTATDEVYLSTAPGTWGKPNLVGSSTSTDVELADIDGDGSLDAVVTDNDGRSYFWRQDQPGVFLRHADFHARDGLRAQANELRAVATASRRLSFVTIGRENPPVMMLNENGPLYNPSLLPLGKDAINDVAIGDIDGDGAEDFVTAHGHGASNTVWLKELGGFVPVQFDLDVDAATTSVTMGDLDGDGDEDVLATFATGKHVVYLNSTANPRGDINLDGETTLDDFLVLSANFGRTDILREDGDLNGDRVVDFADFLILSHAWSIDKAEIGS